MDLGTPPRKFKITLESNPLKSIILVRRLARLAVLGRSEESAPAGSGSVEGGAGGNDNAFQY